MSQYGIYYYLKFEFLQVARPVHMARQRTFGGRTLTRNQDSRTHHTVSFQTTILASKVTVSNVFS